MAQALAPRAALVRDWAHAALTALGEARAEIDALNVFPVPDGDTGTNVYLTMESACHGVDEALDAEPSLAAAARGLARGSLLGARGNSGVIVSQILRGTADVLAAIPAEREVAGHDIAAMLERASDLAYAAVARPVEGTILTVVREAAASARARSGESLAAVVTAATDGAAHALARTPTMLESLRLAGVVDAGGRAFVVILDALAEVVGGVRRPVGSRSALTVPVPHEGGAGYHGPAYEVMYLLDAPAPEVDRLRGRLDALGDSLVIVGDASLWNVHVHVDDPGAAVEAGIEAGRPHRIRITHLRPAVEPAERPSRAIVAVTHGPGVADLMREAGVRTLAALPRQRPSTAEILDGIFGTGAREVIVLPSDSDTRPVAEVAAAEARAAGVEVAVIPTRSVVQSLAAVAVHQPGLRFADDVVAMSRAAGATRYAAVTVATREALTTVGPCRVGDVLGLVDGDISIIGSDVATVSRDLLAGLLSVGGELVTLVFGAEADRAFIDDLGAWIAQTFPMVEVAPHEGGQPLWPLIIGVE